MTSNNDDLQRQHVLTHARRLKECLHFIFNDQDRRCVIQMLSEYQSTRNLEQFVRNLTPFIDTPARFQLIQILQHVIPRQDRALFDAYVANIENGNLVNKNQKLFMNSAQGQTSPNVSSTYSFLPGDHPGSRPQSGLATQRSRTRSVSSIQSRATSTNSTSKSVRGKSPSNHTVTRTITMRSGAKMKLQSLGFSLAYSMTEQGCIVIASVIENSQADIGGLIVGDRLLAINGIPCFGFALEDAIELINSGRSKVALTVAGANTHLGGDSQDDAVENLFAWVDSSGRPVSPPIGAESLPDDNVSLNRVRYNQSDTASIHSNGRSNSNFIRGSVDRRSGLRLLVRSDERKVNLQVPHGSGLGISIRGGAEFGLGIYIAGVDPSSVAEYAGLKIGDKILDINGTSFLRISHHKATEILKKSKQMIMTVQDVGKLPFARAKSANGNSQTGSNLRKSASLPYLAINNNNKSMNSQQSGYNLPPYNNHDEGTTSRSNTFTPAFNTQRVDRMHASRERLTEWADRLLSGKDQMKFWRNISKYRSGYLTIDGLVVSLSTKLLDTSAKLSLLTPLREMIAVADVDRYDNLVVKAEIDMSKKQANDNNQEVYDSYKPHSLQYNSNELQSSSYPNTPDIFIGNSSARRNSQDYFNHTNNGRQEESIVWTSVEGERSPSSTSNRMSPHPDQEHAGGRKWSSAFKTVSIPKTLPTLGMAIEGGANTTEPLPRIVNIKSSGAAALCPYLAIGQIIYEVDGQILEGLDHMEAAKKIATAFRSSQSDSMQLTLVNDTIESNK